MSANSIFVSLLIVFVTILLLYGIGRQRSGIAQFGSQRMCPSCGLITSRLKANCLECCKSLTTVSVTPVLEK
jgi:hypothetical protein